MSGAARTFVGAMGTFASEYPAELRARFIGDALAEGAPAVAELVRQARAGHYGPELRKLPGSTAREWVAEERALRDSAAFAAAAGGMSGDDIAREALELIARDIARVKRDAARPRGKLDVGRLEELLRAAREAERVRATRGAPLKGNGKGGAGESGEAPADAAEQREPERRSPLAEAALET